MARYQIIITYDGTDFAGFQRQANARTVQAEVEKALRKLGWPGRTILAAGRTDSGVHATGQVAAFDLEWRHSAQELEQALNANLPGQVAVRQVRMVRVDFHPRYAALERKYRYRIYCASTRSPLRDRFAWHVQPAVVLEALQAASSCLIGTHNFAAFGTPPRTGGSTIRSVYQATWQPAGEEYAFDITANAFLYRMVRRIVYVLVAVAQGRLELERMQASLDGRPLEVVQGLAPPQGLTLLEVTYPADIYDVERMETAEHGSKQL